MFFVLNTQRDKERKTKEYLNREPMIAVLLAAANFEWTVGRCILFLSKSPNVELHERLSKCHGLDKYKDLWKDELIKHDPSIPPLAEIVKNWSRFQDAFVLRHGLIHGRKTCSRNMAAEPVKIMLLAVDDLYKFASSMKINLHSRLPIRRVKQGR